MSCCCRSLPTGVFNVGAEDDYDDPPPGLIVPLDKVRGMKCDNMADAGGDQPEAFMIDISNEVGNMVFKYGARTMRDRFRLYMDKEQFFDTGCVGNGWLDRLDQSTTEGHNQKTFYVPRGAKRLWIECIPNCLHDIPAPDYRPASQMYDPGALGTVWAIGLICPDGIKATNDLDILKAYKTNAGELDKIPTPTWS